MSKVPKTRAGGRWTEARYRGFITSTIRGATRRWAPISDCWKAAEAGKRINAESGRMAQHYHCACCGAIKARKQMACDHVEPIVPTTGFDSWDKVIERALCEMDGLQILCKEPCHADKTKAENNLRRENKKRVS